MRGANLAQRIAAARIRAGYNKSQLAAALGCALSTVQNWEKGADISTHYLKSLADLTGFSMEEITGIPAEQGYPAWAEFAASPLAKDMTDQERHELERLRFISYQPTVATYYGLLSSLRQATPVEGLRESGLKRGKAKGGRERAGRR